MIASPGDMAAERDATEQVIDSWNRLHSANLNSVLLASRWEYAAPVIENVDGQQILNRDLLNRSHMLVALFGERIGTQTPRALSGTVEEIDEAVARGMAVHVFFSTAPLSRSFDPVQLRRLKEYEEQLKERGLVGYFEKPSDLSEQVMQCLVRDVYVFLGGSQSARTDPRGLLRVSAATDSIGRTVLTVRNEGTSTADAVEVVVRSDARTKPFTLLNQSLRPSIQPGANVHYVFKDKIDPKDVVWVDLRWREEGKARDARLNLRTSAAVPKGALGTTSVNVES